jgi:hypothetical protein
MIKIVHAIKGVFAPEKKPQPPVLYYDQEPMRIKHSSLEAERAQSVDGWCNGYGRYRTNTWFIKK